MTDDQLIDQTLAGQSAAFGHLVTRYQDRLFNSLVQVLGSHEDAADVAQEAFVQAFVKLASFQRSSAFFTWLYRIAWNMAITLRRKQKTVHSVDQLREAGQEPLDGGESPGQRLERHEAADQVRIALGQLSEEHRLILVLREIDGCDYEAIGQILDLPVGTVRSRLHRARSQLRDQLNTVLSKSVLSKSVLTKEV